MLKTHFVPHGRFPALQRERIAQQVVEVDPALVVIQGGPGAGKSVAAAQIADALADREGDLVWVSLTPAERNTVALWTKVFRMLVEA